MYNVKPQSIVISFSDLGTLRNRFQFAVDLYGLGIVDLFTEIVDLFPKRAVRPNLPNPPWLRACHPVEISARNKLQRSARRSHLVESSPTNKPPCREFNYKGTILYRVQLETSHPIEGSAKV